MKPHRLGIFVLAALAPLVGSARFQLDTPSENQAVESLALGNVSLPEAIVGLAKQAGLKVQIDPLLLGQKSADGKPFSQQSVQIKWTRVRPSQALQAVLDNYGWQMERDASTPSFTIRARDAKAVKPPVTKFDLLAKTGANGPGDQVIESLVFAKKVPGIPMRNVALPVEAADALVFENVRLRESISQLATLSGLNIQFDPQLTTAEAANPPIAERWKKVTAKQALDALLNNYGWQMTQSSNNPILRVTVMPPWMTDPRTTKVTSFPEDKAEGKRTVNMGMIGAIQFLATEAKLNVQLDPALTALLDAAGPSHRVNKQWQRVSSGQALLDVLEEQGWQLNRSANSPIFRITAKSRDAF